MDSDDEMEYEDISDTYQSLVESHQLKSYSQAELNDRTQDLGLSKEFTQLLGSRLLQTIFYQQKQCSSGTAVVTKNFGNILVRTK